MGLPQNRYEFPTFSIIVAQTVTGTVEHESIPDSGIPGTEMLLYTVFAIYRLKSSEHAAMQYATDSGQLRETMEQSLLMAIGNRKTICSVYSLHRIQSFCVVYRAHQCD
jgi:hypothetical protein